MAYELKQELKLTQSLVMTPQLQLAIKLLQLSRLELLDAVRQEIQSNPVLEETGEAEASPEGEKDDVADLWQSYVEESEGRPGRLDFSAASEDEEEDYLGNLSAAGGGLHEHLLWQLHMLGLPEEERNIGEFIVGNIGEDGYLRILEKAESDNDAFEKAVVGEVSKYVEAPVEKVAEVLEKVQHLDPPGVGARTLRECLFIQARLLPVRDTVAEGIIRSHLEDLGGRNFKAIARKMGVTVDEVMQAARLIGRCLNPTPGAGFGCDDARYIVPDVYIAKVGDDYVITLNDDGMPKLKLSKYYHRLIKAGAAPEETRAFLRDKMRSALWLIKSIHQRQRTIYRVVETIVRFQREFLDKGLKFLKPMVLKDVADDLGIHESTVSRVTSNKYVQTPRGIFELKFFFSGGLMGSDGVSVTAEYIKEKMKRIIESEDAMSPLSDQEIVRVLNESGINLSRRTAAKYREAIGFLPSNKRKALFES